MIASAEMVEEFRLLVDVELGEHLKTMSPEKAYEHVRTLYSGARLLAICSDCERLWDELEKAFEPYAKIIPDWQIS